MKICILGNCQAQHLEAMLGTAQPEHEVVRLEPVFMMTDAHRGAVYEKLSAADLIFAQRISDEFKMDWLSSAAIRREFGDKVHVWPNLYFDGYFPGVQYIYLGTFGKLLGPLGDYHFSQVYQAHRAGASIDDAVEAFTGDSLFAKTPDPFAQSLGQLQAREADVDVPLSGYIAERVAEARQFYTPNHPFNELLGEMLRRLMERADLPFDMARGVAMPYRLDECYIPASAAIISRYDLPFDHQERYRGREVLSVGNGTVELGAVKDYGARELVESFYRVYDAARAVSG